MAAIKDDHAHAVQDDLGKRDEKIAKLYAPDAIVEDPFALVGCNLITEGVVDCSCVSSPC